MSYDPPFRNSREVDALNHELITLRAELATLKAREAKMREALEGMSELCGNYFDESQLVCERDREIWRNMLEALSTTPPTDGGKRG